MILRDTFFKSLLNQLKTDLLSSLRLFRDTITQDLELEISKVYLRPLSLNKPLEETYEQENINN
jgi:hypothetical protein